MILEKAYNMKAYKKGWMNTLKKLIPTTTQKDFGMPLARLTTKIKPYSLNRQGWGGNPPNPPKITNQERYYKMTIKVNYENTNANVWVITHQDNKTLIKAY